MCHRPFINGFTENNSATCLCSSRVINSFFPTWMRTHCCVFRILSCFRLNSHSAGVASDSRAEIARRVACARARSRQRRVLLTCTRRLFYLAFCYSQNAPFKSLTPSRISASLLQYLFRFSISFIMEIKMPRADMFLFNKNGFWS